MLEPRSDDPTSLTVLLDPQANAQLDWATAIGGQPREDTVNIAIIVLGGIHQIAYTGKPGFIVVDDIEVWVGRRPWWLRWWRMRGTRTVSYGPGEDR